jgi:hypothetical protein
MGWEPKRTVVFGRNAAGQIVTAKITTEAEWDDESRELAFAVEDYEARLCSGCGDDLEETTKIENEEGYEPLPALICWRCVERGRLEKQKVKMREQRGAALLLNVQKKGGADAADLPAEG